MELKCWGCAFHGNCQPQTVYSVEEAAACETFQVAPPAQLFFQRRGITIPGLDPAKWVESLSDGEPVSARFCHDWLTGTNWYESGSGRTRAIIEDDRLLVFDLTGEAEHQQSLMDECRSVLREAGIEPTDPAKSLHWPEPGQVGLIPVGSFSPLWRGGVLVACLGTI